MMKPEDRIRAAYRSLAARAARDVDAGVELGRLRKERGRRMTPALTAAVVAVALIGSVALFARFAGPGSAPQGPADAVPPSTSTSRPLTVDDPTRGSNPTTTPPPAADQVTLYRVDSTRVAADVADPFLDVRVEPDPEARIVAKLPPTYSGVRWLGDARVAPDGAVWYRVQLEDPVPVDVGVVGAGLAGPVGGWVDSAFLIPLPEGLPVTASELTPCDGGTDFERTGPETPMHVSSLRAAEIAPGCTRIVLGFSTGPAPSTWSDVGPGTAPAATLPTWQMVSSPWPLIVQFPDITSAWPDAAGLPGFHLVRQPDRSLSLTVTHPADDVWIRSIPARGLLVVDLRDSARPEPPAGPAVSLTREPTTGPGSVEATGLARPFEGHLSVWVEGPDGGPVEAVFSGSSLLGTRRTDVYTVVTIDWSEAWAPFAVRAEGLPPGDYDLVFDPSGNGENFLRAPFRVDRSGAPPSVPSVEANELALLISTFAQGGAPPPLADRVVLRLADEARVVRSAAELADPSGWFVPAEGFRARTGPFDLLAPLRDRPQLRIDEQRLTPRCAGEPVDWWPTFTLAASPITMEPIGVDSCLEWYSLTVLPDGRGAIAEVVLDLWEP